MSWAALANIMGINVQVETENGLMLEQYLDPEGAVVRLVSSAPIESSTCLRFVDPYGNTTFNQLQLPELIREVEAIANDSKDPDSRKIAVEILRLAKSAASRVHTYIKFIGD
jgi:hypothetical protein